MLARIIFALAADAHHSSAFIPRHDKPHQMASVVLRLCLFP